VAAVAAVMVAAVVVVVAEAAPIIGGWSIHAQRNWEECGDKEIS